MNPPFSEGDLHRRFLPPAGRRVKTMPPLRAGPPRAFSARGEGDTCSVQSRGSATGASFRAGRGGDAFLFPRYQIGSASFRAGRGRPAGHWSWFLPSCPFPRGGRSAMRPVARADRLWLRTGRAGGKRACPGQRQGVPAAGRGIKDRARRRRSRCFLNAAPRVFETRRPFAVLWAFRAQPARSCSGRLSRCLPIARGGAQSPAPAGSADLRRSVRNRPRRVCTGGR